MHRSPSSSTQRKKGPPAEADGPFNGKERRNRLPVSAAAVAAATRMAATAAEAATAATAAVSATAATAAVSATYTRAPPA
jgi:hypothetical protein